MRAWPHGGLRQDTVPPRRGPVRDTHSGLKGLFRLLLVALVFLGFCYLLLPTLIANQIASRLQGTLGLDTEPEVEVVSDFPPELLLGRIDGLRIDAAGASLQGVPLGDARADLRGVSVSVPGLLQGEPAISARSCTLSVPSAAISVGSDEECLSLLGLS